MDAAGPTNERVPENVKAVGIAAAAVALAIGAVLLVSGGGADAPAVAAGGNAKIAAAAAEEHSHDEAAATDDSTESSGHSHDDGSDHDDDSQSSGHSHDGAQSAAHTDDDGAGGHTHDTSTGNGDTHEHDSGTTGGTGGSGGHTHGSNGGGDTNTGGHGHGSGNGNGNGNGGGNSGGGGGHGHPNNPKDPDEPDDPGHGHDGPNVQLAELPEPLQQQISSVEQWSRQFPTAADASAAGWVKQTVYFPGIAAHYINWSYMDSTFDPAHPEVLLYDGNGPGAKLVGINYIVSTGSSPPTGFAGDYDVWHEHPKLCQKNGLVIGGEGLSDAECVAKGGHVISFAGWWLLHVWCVPGWESPDGIFSHANPKLT